MPTERASPSIRSIPFSARFAPPRGTLSLDSAASLAGLRRSLVSLSPLRPGLQLALRHPALGAGAGRMERRLNALYSSCGCNAGALAAVGTVLVLAWRWWHAARVGAGEGRGSWLMALGALVAAALVGKAIGLLWSRVALIVVLWRLERRVAAQVAERG